MNANALTLEAAPETRTRMIPYAGWIMFLVGLTGPFTLRLVGLMPVSEIVLLVVAAYAVLHLAVAQTLPASLVRTGPFLLFVLCQVVGLLGYVVSDLYRESSTSDMARGWARMVFLALDLGCLGLLFSSSRHAFSAYVLGLGCSSIHAALFGALFGDYWKFGFGFPLTVLTFLLAPRLGRIWGLAGGLMITGLHLALDFRSMAFSSLLTTALMAVTYFPRRARGFVLVAGGLVAAGLLSFALLHEASEETMHRRSRSNAERSAMLTAAGSAFLKSPLLGQGSWFSHSDVMVKFAEIRAENAAAAGVGGFDEENGGEMAIHSQLLVSLAEGGLFGASFFIAYGLGLVWAIYQCVLRRQSDRHSGIYLLLLLAGLLNLFFSPFSGVARVDISVAAMLVVMLWQEREAALD